MQASLHRGSDFQPAVFALNPHPEGMTAISRWLREPGDRYHRITHHKKFDPGGIAAIINPAGPVSF